MFSPQKVWVLLLRDIYAVLLLNLMPIFSLNARFIWNWLEIFSLMVPFSLCKPVCIKFLPHLPLLNTKFWEGWAILSLSSLFILFGRKGTVEFIISGITVMLGWLIKLNLLLRTNSGGWSSNSHGLIISLTLWKDKRILLYSKIWLFCSEFQRS